MSSSLPEFIDSSYNVMLESDLLRPPFSEFIFAVSFSSSSSSSLSSSKIVLVSSKSSSGSFREIFEESFFCLNFCPAFTTFLSFLKDWFLRPPLPDLTSSFSVTAVFCLNFCPAFTTFLSFLKDWFLRPPLPDLTSSFSVTAVSTLSFP